MANRPPDTTTVSPLSIAASVMWAAPRLAGAGGVGLASGTAILTGLAAEGTSVGAGSGAALDASTGFAGAGGATGLAGLSAATVATAIGAAGAITASPSARIGAALATAGAAGASIAGAAGADATGAGGSLAAAGAIAPRAMMRGAAGFGAGAATPALIGLSFAAAVCSGGWIGSISLAVGVGMTIATCCVASGFGLLLASSRLGVLPGAGPSAAKPRSSRTIISLSRDPALRPPRMTAMIRWPLRTAELAR